MGRIIGQAVQEVFSEMRGKEEELCRWLMSACRSKEGYVLPGAGDARAGEDFNSEGCGREGQDRQTLV